MHTTNDAHKYLREPPTVKPFPIKYSSATHRKIGEALITAEIGMRGRLRLATVHNRCMPKRVIHISEKEAAATDVATLLAHLRAGAEVVIENGERPVAVLHAAAPLPGRPTAESIALAEARAKELGYEPPMAPDFAADLEKIIKSRKPRNVSTWD